MSKQLFNVKPGSVRVLLAGIALLILFNVMARFGVFDLTSTTSNFMTMIGAFFLLSEVSIVAMIRRRAKLSILNVLISIVALLAIVGSFGGIIGWNIQTLSPIQGIVDIGLLISVIVEIFRK